MPQTTETLEDAIDLAVEAALQQRKCALALYGVVTRENRDNYEFIDRGTLSGTSEDAEAKYCECEGYTKMRIVKVRVIEEKTIRAYADKS